MSDTNTTWSDKEMLDVAWGIIDTAGKNWETKPESWVQAAGAFRDQYNTEDIAVEGASNDGPATSELEQRSNSQPRPD